MNDCRELEPLLAAYVDGQADAAERARIDAHVGACAGCRDRVAAQRTVCDSMRARRDALRGCASEALKGRCAAFAPRNPAVPSPSRVRTFVKPAASAWRWVPMTAAATVVLAIAAVFGLGLNNKVQALAVQATMDHAACSRIHMAKAAADPVGAAERWQQRFGWTIKVPASTDQSDLELRAVRRCAMSDGRVAHMLYIWQGEPLSVYVLPRAVVERAPAYVHRFGHDAVMWSQNDRTYLVVANRRRDAGLDRVVAYVQANAY